MNELIEKVLEEVKSDSVPDWLRDFVRSDLENTPSRFLRLREPTDVCPTDEAIHGLFRQAVGMGNFYRFIGTNPEFVTDWVKSLTVDQQNHIEDEAFRFHSDLQSSARMEAEDDWFLFLENECESCRYRHFMDDLESVATILDMVHKDKLGMIIRKFPVLDSYNWFLHRVNSRDLSLHVGFNPMSDRLKRSATINPDRWWTR